jgi:hypothetical protein
MNLSRRERLAAGAASAASALPALPNTTEPSTQSKRAVPPPAQTLPAPNLPIRDYLAREARRITDNALVDLKTPEEFNRRLPQPLETAAKPNQASATGHVRRSAQM